MSILDVARRYFVAWNQRNPQAIVAAFAEGGAYRDPMVPYGLSGPALADNAAAFSPHSHPLFRGRHCSPDG